MHEQHSYKCGICGKPAPEELREHGAFAEKIAWLRKHYRREHPKQFKKWTKV